MAHPVKGVDHVFLLVNDLDSSRAQFERLGFTVSPRGLHSAHKGSANHTIMFPEDYFELLGLIAETEANAPRRAMLARDGEGLQAVACRIDDAAAAERELSDLGIGAEGLSDFSRPVPLPSGGEGTAAFSTLQFRPDEVPLGTCFMCQHKTRETVWLPELLEHRNGALGLAGVVAATPDPRRVAEGFARLFADGKVSTMEDGMRVETGSRSAPLFLLDPDALAKRYAGLDMGKTPRNAFAALQLIAPDLPRVRSILDAAGVTHGETPAGLAVDPSDASGCAIEFLSP